MELFVKIIVCLIAGLGAGFGTGLAGLSVAERENHRFAVSEETGQKKKGDTKVSPL